MYSNEKIRILHQIEGYLNQIKKQGLILETGSDFEYFKSIPKHQRARHNINPAFDPTFADLNEGNSLWMTVLNEEGEIVGTQAMQILPLGTSNFGNYLKESVWNFRTYGYDLDEAKTRCHLTSAAYNIAGTVAYHGELWLKGGENGIRGGTTVIMLTRLMILVGMLKWSPDFFIGLQSPLTSCKGLAIREGYMHTEQRSIEWYQSNSDVPMEDWLVWMSREEAEFNLRLPAEFFNSIYETNKTNTSTNSIGKIA